MTDLKEFQYQILRYCPDRFRGEFINLGIVVMAMDEPAVWSRFCAQPTRLAQFFPAVNVDFVISTVVDIGEDIAALPPADTVVAHTSQVLPIDDSALYFTPVKTALNFDGEAMMTELYRRMVEGMG